MLPTDPGQDSDSGSQSLRHLGAAVDVVVSSLDLRIEYHARNGLSEGTTQGVGPFGRDDLVVRRGDDRNRRGAASQICGRLELVAQKKLDGSPGVMRPGELHQGVERSDQDRPGHSPVLGAVGQRFEFSRPDQIFPIKINTKTRTDAGCYPKGASRIPTQVSKGEGVGGSSPP